MKYLKIIFPFLIILIAISCTKKSNEYNISFQEQSFANDVLATVSMLNDSVYVVGGENGEIYLLNSLNDSLIGNYKPDLARVYCLYADGDTFYAGVRNSGIVKLVKKDKKLKRVKQQYEIPQKGTNYSPYNIIPYRVNTLIATTSNGLYYFSNDTLDVLYPIPYGPDSGNPFVYCSPISIGDDIYVGTSKGIVKINSKHGKPEVDSSYLVNKAISKVIKENDNIIYALSECPENDTLYTINIKDNSISIDTCGLDFSALSFVKAEDKFYFVMEGGNYIQLPIPIWPDRVDPKALGYYEAAYVFRPQHDWDQNAGDLEQKCVYGRRELPGFYQFLPVDFRSVMTKGTTRYISKTRRKKFTNTKMDWRQSPNL